MIIILKRLLILALLSLSVNLQAMLPISVGQRSITVIFSDETGKQPLVFNGDCKVTVFLQFLGEKKFLPSAYKFAKAIDTVGLTKQEIELIVSSIESLEIVIVTGNVLILEPFYYFPGKHFTQTYQGDNLIISLRLNIFDVTFPTAIHDKENAAPNNASMDYVSSREIQFDAFI